MNAIILWIVIIGILAGLFLLTRLYIVKYFESKKGRFDADKSNFITSIGIGAILTAFFVINPNMILQLINVVIEFFNKTLSTQLSPLDYQPGLADIIAFSILCLTIFGLIFVSYRHRSQLHQQHLAELSAQAKEEKVIRFPESRFFESPLLPERIKELIELKFKKYGLKMAETKQPGEDKFIYGWYNDDFHTYFEIVYCESSRGSSIIGQEDIERIYRHLDQEIYAKASEGHKNPIPHFYYISENGTFENVTDQYFMICLTEKEFLHTVINFKPYLKKLVEKFQTEKLFSAIQKEEDKKTLSETFIEPGFKLGAEAVVHEDLIGYLRTWLRDGSDSKHQVLLGGYGMGKTSFMKYFAANLAQSILNNQEISRIPVFISLTNCSPTHGGIKKTIQAFVAENLGIEYDLFERLIEKGKFVFLLDAFDEMGFIGSNQQRFKQFNEIWQLAVKNNKIILSGRPSYFPTEFEMHDTLAIPAAGEEVLQTRPYAGKVILSDLNEARIRKYIAKYYPTDVDTYVDWIKKDRSLFELCKRPSMMHIIREMLPTLYEQERDKDITAGKLIHQYITHWIGRQHSKNIQSAFEENERRKTEFIFSFFTDLAADIYLTSELKMSGNDILQKLRKKMQAFGIKGLENPEIKEGIEQEIMTGYFIERELDAFKFVHKSFFEYFVSLKIVELFNEKAFNHKLIHTEWTIEVNDFVYDFIPVDLKNDQYFPSLLLFVSNNNRFLCRIKLNIFHFSGKLIESPSREDYLITFYATLLVCFFLLLIAIKKDTHIFGSSVLYYTALIFILLIVFSGTLALISRKSNLFIEKAIKIGVNRKEPASLSLLNNILRDYVSNISISGVGWVNPRDPINIKVSFYDSKLSDFSIEVPQNMKYILFVDSELHQISFSSDNANRIIFRNSNLIKLNFENVICKSYHSNYHDDVRDDNTKGRFFKRTKMAKIAIERITPSQIDEYTINSLVQFILKNKLRLGIEIKTDDWLQEVLRQKLEAAASGKNS